MHTPETIEQFIQKRADGMALHRIADEIGVSKSTLVAWSEKYALEIAATQQDADLEHHNRLLAKLNHRESQLDDAYNRVSPIIDDFNPEELSIMQAFRLFFMIQRESIKLQTLRLKIEEAGTKLLLPPSLQKRSSFGQVCERSEQPPSLIEPEDHSKLTHGAPAPEVAVPESSKSGGLVNPLRKRSNSGQSVERSDSPAGCPTPVTHLNPPRIRERRGQTPKVQPAAARNGQETKQPDPARDNFLSVISNPPQPQILRPPAPDNTPIIRAGDKLLLLPSKLPKETLEIAHRILPKEAPPKPAISGIEQPQSIAEYTNKFSDA